MRQWQTLDEFGALLRDINRRINLISREDEDAVFEHHILHSLCLTFRAFASGAVVVDWGTGGGLPSIPLAVAMPDVHFIAVDAVGKKVRAVETMARRLGLLNLEAWHGRAEDYDGSLDYSVSRATAPLATLWFWHSRAERPASRVEEPESVGEPELWRPGLVCLKGGDLAEEKAALPASVEIEDVPLYPLLGKAYFTDKIMVACSSDAGVLE